MRDAHVLIHSDNQGTVGAILKGKSRSAAVNRSVQRLYDFAICAAITPSLVYVRSEDNPADPLSRGIRGARGKKIVTEIRLPSDVSASMFFL